MLCFGCRTDGSKAQIISIQMERSFGQHTRLKIRSKSGSDRLLSLDAKASRQAREKWSAGIWQRLVQYANGTLPEKEDATNVLRLMIELGWSLRVEAIWAAERVTLESRIIKEAGEVLPQVKEILFWIAEPGKNMERDRRAVKTIADHFQATDLSLVKERVVSRSFGTEHLLDAICRFVYDLLQQANKDLACLPDQSPIRI